MPFRRHIHNVSHMLAVIVSHNWEGTMRLKLFSALAAFVWMSMGSLTSAVADGGWEPPPPKGGGAYEVYKRRAAEQRELERNQRRFFNNLQRRERERRRWHRARRDRDYYRSCVAIARRGGGRGRSIGIVTEGFGHRACRKAMRRCNRRLDVRQSYGRNPFAACVIAGRG